MPIAVLTASGRPEALRGKGEVRENAAQQRADAVVVHVDAEALRAESASGQSALEDGVRVPAESSRRLACHASRVVMTHAADGVRRWRSSYAQPRTVMAGAWRLVFVASGAYVT